MVLRLHDAKNNNVILIHDNDWLFIRTDSEGKTRIRLKDTNFDAFTVNESPDKIYNMIRDTQKN